MLALYRKYRPRSLSEVIAQPQVTEPLEKSLANGKISHSYLFTGPRGCGKTSVARILAHEVNGFKYEIEDSYLDIIEIDAASNTGVDNIRNLREKALIAPSEGKYKVYIIDEVHMLSKSAFNALLKTLEEPPEHVIFILATTDFEKVPVTITSRSQVYQFRLASSELILPYLQKICKTEKIKISDSALKLIIKKGGGSFRDTLSLLDQVSILGTKDEISEEKIAECLGLPLESSISALLEAYTSRNTTKITELLKTSISEGLKPESLTSSLIEKIISLPSLDLLPLLEKLSAVSAPFPEAKLLLALLSFPSAPKEEIETTQAIQNQQAQKTKTDPKPEIKTSKKTSVPTNQAAEMKKETNSPKNPKQNNSNSKTLLPTTLSPALLSQLKKCTIHEESNVIHIYPSTNLTKIILDRPTNRQTLSSAFEKEFVVHDFGEAKNSSKFSQISDIMGNIQEVNDNGGIPF